jgi:hypothetical protein
MKAMKKYRSTLITSTFLIALLVVPGYSSFDLVYDRQMGQKKAEEIGDRILQRLHAQMDFTPVFREFFVSDTKMRQREVELVFGRRLNPQYRRQINQAAVERAYIALWNFWYLFMTYTAAQDAKPDTPPEIENAYNLMKVDLEQITSGQELDEKYTNKMNDFFGVLRKYIPQNIFESETYKRNWTRFKEEEETADVEQMRQDFGLGKEVEIYVVKREFFNYFLLQEGDAMKVFTMSLRTKKRL